MNKKAYEDLIQQYQQTLTRVNRTYSILSYSRLICFLLGIAITYFVFQAGYESASIFVGSLLLVLFMYLIKIHTDVANQREYLQHLVDINQLEIDVQAGKRQDLDEGKEYIDPMHPYSFDLDLFGRASIFQYINRCSTILGKNQLADALKQPPTQADEILGRQAAIQEIEGKLNWSQHFQAVGQGKIEELGEINALLTWLKEPVKYVHSRLYKVLLWLMPLLFVLTIVGWFAGFSPPHLILIVFLLELLVVGWNLKTTNDHHAQVGRKSRLLNKYAALLKAIEEEQFETELLLELQAQLSASGQSASEAINQLGTITYYLDQRMNAAAALILNGVVLWDLQCVSRLEKWKLAYQSQMEDWFRVIANLDAFVSLGRFGYNHPSFCRAELQSEDFVIDSVELGHPLIPDEVRVNNDVDMKQGEFLIITGANMAGKSTFLRTVGVNLILAMMGAPVCAKQYRFAPIQMISSVRATDSLVDNESYFYAELKRLKTIIDQLKEGPAFVIVDEMLRGTNSRDKQTGSRRFIENLIRLHGVGLIATHDLALGKLADDYPKNVRNKRFEVAIEGEELFFDYKLQEGISQNLNATFLMEQMGIM